MVPGIFFQCPSYCFFAISVAVILHSLIALTHNEYTEGICFFKGMAERVNLFHFIGNSLKHLAQNTRILPLLNTIFIPSLRSFVGEGL